MILEQECAFFKRMGSEQLGAGRNQCTEDPFKLLIMLSPRHVVNKIICILLHYLILEIGYGQCAN